MLAPAPDLVTRFRDNLAALTGAPPARLGVAISGGPDSLALLLLARAVWPERVVAATVDHGLRPENAEEAAFVADLCVQLDVSHATLSGRVPDTGSVQAGARDVRYRLLRDWAVEAGCSHLATAHHADDQAETLLMRLARGSGLPGLAGIRQVRDLGGVTILRPLLGWRRAELAEIVAVAGLTAVDDPSNRSPAYDRTRFRALLSGTEELPPLRLARAAANLADCDDALGWAAHNAWGERVRAEGEMQMLDPAGLPREIRRRLVRRAIEGARDSAGLQGSWREDGMDRLLETLENGGRASLAEVLCTGGPVWRFAPAPPRNPSGSATVQPKAR